MVSRSQNAVIYGMKYTQTHQALSTPRIEPAFLTSSGQASRTTCRGAAPLRPSYPAARIKAFFLNLHLANCSALSNWLRNLSFPKSYKKSALQFFQNGPFAGLRESS